MGDDVLDALQAEVLPTSPCRLAMLGAARCELERPGGELGLSLAIEEVSVAREHTATTTTQLQGLIDDLTKPEWFVCADSVMWCIVIIAASRRVCAGSWTVDFLGRDWNQAEELDWPCFATAPVDEESLFDDDGRSWRARTLWRHSTDVLRIQHHGRTTIIARMPHSAAAEGASAHGLGREMRLFRDARLAAIVLVASGIMPLSEAAEWRVQICPSSDMLRRPSQSTAFNTLGEDATPPVRRIRHHPAIRFTCMVNPARSLAKICLSKFNGHNGAK